MKGGPLKLCLSKFDFSGPPPPVLYDQSLIFPLFLGRHIGSFEEHFNSSSYDSSEFLVSIRASPVTTRSLIIGKINVTNTKGNANIPTNGRFYM